MTPLRTPSRFTTLLALVLSSAFAAPIAADDWPQWRGPNRDGRSAESGLLGAWPEAGPPLLWSAPGFGTGFSSVAIANRTLYTLGDLGDSQYLIAASAGDGAFRWRVKLGPAWDDEFPGPRSTPTVAGGKVYALGTEGDLVCVDARTGDELWRRNLRRDFAGRQMEAGSGNQTVTWKFSESPLVDGGHVVVTPGGSEALMVALDAGTGTEVWRTKVERPLGERGKDGAGYSSIVISEAAGVKQYIQLVGRGVVGIDAATGRLLWSYDRVANEVANIPTPLVSGNLVFVSTGYRTGAALLEITKDEKGALSASERYFLDGNVFQNHHGNMVLVDGVVYAGHGHNRGYPIAITLDSGEIRWGPISNSGNGSAAVAWADGRLYMRYQNGLMVLVETSPEEYRERGSFLIPDVKRQSWSHPVISGGRLVLREQDRIHVYDLRAATP